MGTTPRVDLHTCDALASDIARTLQLHEAEQRSSSHPSATSTLPLPNNNLMMAHSMGGSALMNQLRPPEALLHGTESAEELVSGWYALEADKLLKKIIYNSTLRKFIRDALVARTCTEASGTAGGAGVGSLARLSIGLEWGPHMAVLSRDVEAFLRFPHTLPEEPPCEVPVLFIHGARSDYTQRNKDGKNNIPRFFANATEVIVP